MVNTSRQPVALTTIRLRRSPASPRRRHSARRAPRRSPGTPMAAGDRVGAVDRGLHRAVGRGDQPVADREGALLVELQLLRRFQLYVHSRRHPCEFSASGRRGAKGSRRGSRTTHLAHMMHFRGDDLLVEVEEVHALPRLIPGAPRASRSAARAIGRPPSPAMTESACGAPPRCAGRDRRRRRAVRPCRWRSFDDDHDQLGTRKSAAQFCGREGAIGTTVTRPMDRPSARISSMVSLIVPLTEPMATTTISASSIR